MERARRSYRLPHNPVAGIEKPRSATKTTINVFSPEEVHALVRAAECEVDAAIFLTAAFTGLRQGELVALRWRDVEFAGAYIRVISSYTQGQLTTPKSGKVRSVPMAPEVAQALARLGQSRQHVGEDDLVFERVPGQLPRRVSAASPLQGRAETCRSAPAALPRPAPHVWHAGDRQGRHPPRPGVDGSRRRADHDAVPALRASPQRRGGNRRGLCVGSSHACWTPRRKRRRHARIRCLRSGSRPADRFDA